MKKQAFTAYAADPEALQNRIALRIASRLSEAAASVAPDVSERLRFARERALQSAREARQRDTAPSHAILAWGGAAALAGGPRDAPGWWVKVASALPLVALVAGLILIQRGHLSAQIATAAEVDAALLADDLPPAAYGDAGFVEFLKAPHD